VLWISKSVTFCIKDRPRANSPLNFTRFNTCRTHVLQIENNYLLLLKLLINFWHTQCLWWYHIVCLAVPLQQSRCSTMCQSSLHHYERQSSTPSGPENPPHSHPPPPISAQEERNGRHFSSSRLSTASWKLEINLGPFLIFLLANYLGKRSCLPTHTDLPFVRLRMLDHWAPAEGTAWGRIIYIYIYSIKSEGHIS
jgi:hypothetical protein